MAGKNNFRKKSYEDWKRKEELNQKYGGLNYTVLPRSDFNPDNSQKGGLDLKTEENDANEVGAEREKINGGLEASEISALDQIGAGLRDQDDQIGEGYNGDDNSRVGRLLKFSLNVKKRKKTLVGGGLAAGLAAALISGFLALVPLKLNHIMANLQSHFFGTAESAVSNETNTLFSKYIKSHVIPSLGPGCPNTRVSKNCSNTISESGKLGNLYHAWKDARLENSLADKYGVEFGQQGGNYYVKAPGLKTEGEILPNDIATSSTNIFDTPALKRKEVRAAVSDALNGETRFKRIMYRIKVGRLMEKKYGIKRCVIACDIRDDFSDWGDSKKKAAKIIFARRVLAPRSEFMALILECVVNGGSGKCDPNKDPNDSGGANGEERSPIQKELDAKLTAFGEKFGKETLDKVLEISNGVLEKGFGQYVIEQAVGSVLGDASGEVAGKAVPVIGYVDAASKVIEFMKTAGPKLKRYNYMFNAAQMVATYMIYRTHADEIKNGHVDAELVGSFVSSLGPNTKKDGSGSSAEGTPLYANLFGGDSQQSSFLDNILPSKAYAAAAEPSTDYVCDNGKPVPKGDVICPEEKLTLSNSLTEVSAAFETFPLNILGTVSSAWRATAGHILSLVGGIFGAAANFAFHQIPFVDQLENKIGEITSSFAQTIFKYLINSPFSDDMSGGRTFDMAAGGADVAGNDYAHHGLGSQQLTPTQARSIRAEQEDSARSVFQQKPLYARLFDKESQYSLVSQVAMAMPMDAHTAVAGTLASLVSNPFSKIGGVFGSFFTTPKAHAQVAAQEDPFGVTQYGYLDSDPVFSNDPEMYTEDYCKNQDKMYNDNTYSNDATYQDENLTTNPCMLVNATIGSAGGYMTDSVLSPDDLADEGSTGTPAGAIDLSTVYEPSDSVPCSPGTNDVGVQNGDHDGVTVPVKLCALPDLPSSGPESTSIAGANGNAIVNSRASGAFLSLVSAAKTAGLAIGATSSFTFSIPNHQMGLAIDFSCSGKQLTVDDPCYNWLFQNAAQYEVKNNPAEAWHWSVTGI